MSYYDRYDSGTQEIKFDDYTSKDFRREIVAGFRSIKPGMRKFLRAQDVQFDAPAVAKFKKTGNSGNDDSRGNLYECGAWYDPSQNKVVVNEQTVTKKGDLVPHRGLAQAIRHEYGHAFDSNVNDYSDIGRFKAAFLKAASSNTWMSESPSFRAAYQADLAALGGVTGATAKGFGYFVTKDNQGTVGFHEVFAEQWAYQNGGGVIPSLPGQWPNTQKWMARFLKGHEMARTQGPAAVRAFIEGFGKNEHFSLQTSQRGGQKTSLADKAAKSGNYETIWKGEDRFLRTKIGQFDFSELKSMKDAINKDYPRLAQIMESTSSPGAYYLAIKLPDKDSNPGGFPDMIANAVSAYSPLPSHGRQPGMAPG